MSKTKELIICAIAIIALILSITLSVSATSINDLLGNVDNQNIQTVPEKTENVNAIVPTTNNVANNNTNNSTNVIPYTGTNSFSIIAIIAVCGVAAVYAYKKIRDYNNV